MKLIELEIEDFKSIKKLKWNLNQGLICLVGQNESGKSNLIEVLDFLNEKKIETLSFEEHTNRASDRYLKAERPLFIATYELNTKAKKNLIQELGPFIPDTEKLKEFNDFEEFIIRSEQRISENGSGSGLYYFENKEHYWPLHYFDIAPTNLPKVINILNNLKTNIIKLREDYIDSFELTIQQITTNELPDAALVKLIKLAGVSDLTKLPTEHKSLNRYLKRLNLKLNDNFTKKYYSQDSSVELKIVNNSNKLYLEITDDTEADYAIHERSEGFKYFFGLLIEAASISNSQTDIIFVLDEPGSKLHPSGQKDLLKYLEELSTSYRVIYTTHSPFLINRLFPNRVRVVIRDKRRGTEFKDKGFSKNWHPMRSALGLCISDSFYYSEKVLIVEGPEDIIYLGALLNLFNIQKEIEISSDIFSFIDSGGESNLPSMVQIMLDEERPTMVLMDSDSQRTYNKILNKSKSSRSGLLVLNQIKDFNPRAVSIEDLIPKGILIKAVNSYVSELLKDSSLRLIKDKNSELKKITTSSSCYKNEIAPFIKENFINPSKNEAEWSTEKVPLSKVGIARHFEIVLGSENFDYSSFKTEFGSSLKMIKTIINKLKLNN